MPSHIIFVSRVKKFFKDFIYLCDRARQPGREGKQQGSGRGRTRLPAEELHVGLDPRSPGSRPELKADAQ